MAKPAKRHVPGGRVTPKGSAPKGSADKGRAAAGRYTPPIPREVKVSPRWVPILMFTLLGAGMIIIFFNYLSLLPGGVHNSYLGIGLACICGGIVTATQYR